MKPVLVLIALVSAGCVSSSAPPGDNPDWILGAIGHSFMLGYNADERHRGAHPEISWPTGEEPWSFASRFGASGTENVARGGASSTTFPQQAENLTQSSFVLVSFLDGDVCASVGAVLGTVPGGSTFEQDLRAGVRGLLARGVEVMLVTQPDIRSIAEAARGRPPLSDQAMFYTMGQQCASEPGFDARQRGMNEMILRIAQEEGALSDQGRTYSIAWTPEMISTVDGFHPSPTGLEAMADAAWAAFVDQRPLTHGGAVVSAPRP